MHINAKWRFTLPHSRWQHHCWGTSRLKFGLESRDQALHLFGTSAQIGSSGGQSFWVDLEESMECLARTRAWLKGLRKVGYGALVSVFALVGAVVGAVTGAVTGQTTETGLVRGAGIGALAGAVISVDVLDGICNGESLSTISIFASLIDGKIFREWVSPAVLKAYQWQISNLQSRDRENTSRDIFDVGGNKGMALEAVEKLHELSVKSVKVTANGQDTCAVCLQDFREGDRARKLPICGHLFHSLCIDAWLIRQGTCPMCRINIGN